jgi:hypothetical protein
MVAYRNQRIEIVEPESLCFGHAMHGSTKKRQSLAHAAGLAQQEPEIVAGRRMRRIRVEEAAQALLGLRSSAGGTVRGSFCQQVALL